MIKVYQIQLSDAEVDAINRGEESEKSKAFFSKMFDSPLKAEIFEHYTHVATVQTNSMDDAYRLMNLWDYPELVERHGSCSSMSVGDIVEVDGKLFRCASFGFDALEA